VFLCCRAPARQDAQQAVAPDSPTAASETAMWRSIESSTDPTDYMNYMKQYPDGAHLAAAMLRVESYALGLNFGLGLMRQPVDLDTASVLRGLEDQMADGKTQMTKDELDAAMADLQTRASANRDRQRFAAGEKASYALGMNYGRNLAKNSIDADKPSLLRGLKDTLTGEKPLLTADVAQAALTESRIRSSVKQDEMHKQVAEANRKDGAAFLASNKTKEGVVVLPSGLQYKILKRGAGARPTASDAVNCNYRGTLLNGDEFDSSYKRGDPATFMLREAIPGWAEALQLMPVGSKWQLFIPPELAYGDAGRGTDIGPDATVILEVELVSIIQRK
jgi:FKBP-type peptidyl-prolyl cis-trans isomerase FklB